MLCILHSLYSWRNTLRHSPSTPFTSRGLWRIALHLSHDLKVKKEHMLRFRTLGSNPYIYPLQFL
jgi:hypothetical protein